MSIGTNLRRTRKEQGLTQAQLAEKAGISRSYYADIEKDYYNPSLDTLQRIAKALCVAPSVLLGDAGILELIAADNGMESAFSMLQKVKQPANLDTAKSDNEMRLVSLYRVLNHDGQEKLLETADDMVQSGKYISPTTGGLKRDGEKMA